MNTKNTEQVGEVQGDARAMFEAWSKSAGLETKIYAHNDMYSHPVTRGAWMAWQHLAARQPEAWQVNATRSSRGWESCTRECYDDTLRTGRYMGLPAGTKDVEVRALYAAPPAQGIDLGPFREAVEAQHAALMSSWCGDPETKDAADQQRDRLLALIDQRDAAPGAGNG